MKKRSNKSNIEYLLPKGIKYLRTPPNKIIVNVTNTRYPIIAEICR
jgi:hypothetical protein